MSLRLRQFYEFGPFRVDTADRLLYRAGKIIALPPKAFDLLLVLIRRKGQTVERGDLIRTVWPSGLDDLAALSFNIYKLRVALGESANKHQYIVTDPGRGYRLTAEVRELWDDDSGAAQTLAVLPFKPLAGSQTDEYLGLGIADALISRLSNVRQVMVRPTSAVSRYDRLGPDPLTAGRRLQVESVLDGSIRRAGAKVQVAVQLLNVPTESAVLSQKYEGQFAEFLGFEDEISERIVDALSIQLSPEERVRLRKRHTESRDAYQEYLKGRYYWSKRSADGVKKGAEHFERAIQLDRYYAMAYAGLADCYSLYSFYSIQPPRNAFPKARAAAATALEIDESLAEAYVSLGYVKLYYDWDWVGAEKEFRRAISLNPNYATARHWYHEFLLSMGWFEEAMVEIKRAYDLDPLSPVINSALVLPLIHAGQYDRAVERIRKVLDLDPDFYRSHLFLGAAYTMKREFSKAVAEFQVAVILSEGSTRALAALGYGYAISGKKLKAQKVLDDLMQRSQQQYVPPYAMALINAGLGNRDEAFRWLDAAYETRDEWLVRLKVAPELAGLRSDARFVELLRRMGLAP
ncbi:MAG TPA: winged helix-turn-helix domain-containing protein [Blastocatellia bacterium]|nr:winged helix-turn-helix domain-containing protein [Blastocatellia bacterium]